MEDTILRFADSGIEEYEPFYEMLVNWQSEIINSFTLIDGRRINNSFIESKNRILEKLLYNGNGFKNFQRTRNRILYCIIQPCGEKLHVNAVLSLLYFLYCRRLNGLYNESQKYSGRKCCRAEWDGKQRVGCSPNGFCVKRFACAPAHFSHCGLRHGHGQEREFAGPGPVQWQFFSYTLPGRGGAAAPEWLEG
jgi:hypothetical protein